MFTPRSSSQLVSLPLLCALTGAGGLAHGVGFVWGAGTKPCSDFLASSAADLTVTPITGLAGEGYRAYREWLAGLVTGLNLATGRDVLQGAELDAAMIRIRANCERHPADDFFNASMRLIKSLEDPLSP